MISAASSDRFQVPSPGPASTGFRRFLPIDLGKPGRAGTRRSGAQAGAFGLFRLFPALGRADRGARRIFLVSGETLAAYHWRRGGSAPPIRFESNAEGLERFSAHVAELPTEPVHVLVDFVEEEFREDSLPRLIGPERRALIQARRKRLFRDPTWGCSLHRGRIRDGAREDRILFTALTRPEILTPWLDVIARNRVPLAGVHSLPLLTERLLSRIPVDASPALVVTWQSAGGLRQTLIVDGKVELSRLAVPPPLEDDEQALYVLSEVEKLRRYLERRRPAEREDPLPVYIVANPVLSQAIERHAPASAAVRYRLVSLSGLGHRLGIGDARSLVWSDSLFVATLASHIPGHQYAPARLVRNYLLHRVRGGLRRMSLLLFIAGLFGSASGLAGGFGAGSLAASLDFQTALYRQRYDEARRRLPATPVELPAMQFAVETARGLIEARTLPGPALLALSRVLDRHPESRIESIDWGVEPNGGPPASRARADHVLAAQPPAGGEVLESGPSLHQLAEIHGRIEPFDGNFRHALEQVGALADSLRSLPGSAGVDVLSLPLDITSGASLRGDAGARAGATEAPFALRLRWSPPRPTSMGHATTRVGDEKPIPGRAAPPG